MLFSSLPKLPYRCSGTTELPLFYYLTVVKKRDTLDFREFAKCHNGHWVRGRYPENGAVKLD